MSKLFAPGIPIPTLIHEILHALQKDNHITSAHGTTSIQINESKNLSFDETANAIYQEVLKKGILTEYLKN